MGTTRDALLAGSTSYVLVASIEGYSKLLHGHDSDSAVVTAYAGTDWTTALGGLTADVQISQSLNPDEPFVRTGTCNLWVVPVPGDDSFGVTVAKKTSTFETYLDATLTNEATTVTVKSTAGLSNGDTIHIGTECIGVGTVASSTSLTGCTRGKFSPFGSYADSVLSTPYSSRHFSHYHRVGLDSQSVNIQPRVTSLPRSWHGRLVAVRAHRVVGGVLDTLAESELLFAGRILDLRDDANTFAVVLQLTSIVESYADAVVGSAQWEGIAEDGFYLYTGQVFGWIDVVASVKTANALTVVASGASGANQINAGYYTLGDLCSAISTWTAAEGAAGRLAGSYSMASPVSIPGGELKTKIYWTLTGANSVSWQFSMPLRVSSFFGFDNVAKTDAANPDNVVVGYVGVFGSAQHFHPGTDPQRAVLVPNGGPSARAVFTTKSGVIADQYDSLPGAVKPAVSLSLAWGLFILGDKRLVIAAFDEADATAASIELLYIQSVLWDSSKETLEQFQAPITLSAPSGDLIPIRQICAFESDPVLIVTSLALSCGPSDYNNPLIELPLGFGAGIPYELVSGMIPSIAKIPSMGGSMAIILEKPTKLSDLLKSDFVFRWTFLYWRDGGMVCGSWKTPTAALAAVTLDESNKAEPSGHQVNQRTTTSETAEWLRQVVKIRYNRDATDPRGESYKSLIQFMDRGAIDEVGGASTVATISLRNTYSEFAGTGQSVESLLDDHLALMPLVSRPAKKATRSISPPLFLAIGLGDIVEFTDTFARDPETGLRGISERPALVTRQKYTFGGMLAGSDQSQPMGGDVDLYFTDTNPDRVGAMYVPSADIDDTYSASSYDHGYLAAGPTIRVLANRYSETTDGTDTAFFLPGDKVLIVERDPADPDAPTKWERTIAGGGVAANALTLTAALSSPAWDATKHYHVISQTYSAATTTQHIHAYQADETDGLIEDTAQPYLYASGAADSTYTTNAAIAALYPLSAPAAIEMLPSLVRIDGAGRDVASEAALVRLLDNLIDYKTAMQCPMLGAVTSNTSYASGYLLVDYFPIFGSLEILSNAVYRYLTVAPWAYSTDGTSTKIRVTLSRERPSFPTTQDVGWSGTFAQVEWTGITSTTPGALSDGVLSANVKNPTTGEAWVAIELGYKCATRGLAKFLEGVRQSA